MSTRKTREAIKQQVMNERCLWEELFLAEKIPVRAESA